MSPSDPAERRSGAPTRTRRTTDGHTVSGLRVRPPGQFGVEMNGVPVRLRGDECRAVPATLLPNGGHTVTTTHLIERIWSAPPHPPREAPSRPMWTAPERSSPTTAAHR